MSEQICKGEHNGHLCVLASNGDLVKKAATIATTMGYNLLNPGQVREKLNLQKRWG